MKLFSTHRRKVISAGLAVGLVLAGGGAAFAASWYLSATGTKSITITAANGATGTQGVSVNVTTYGTLSPSTPVQVGVMVSNDTGTAPAIVSDIELAIGSITPSDGSACTAADLTLVQPVYVLEGDGTPLTFPGSVVLPVSRDFTSAGATGSSYGTLALTSPGQNECVGAAITLTATVS
jgi:hypothetical protein